MTPASLPTDDYEYDDGDHDRKLVHSSKNPNHRTPKELFKWLDQEFHFDIDACASKGTSLCNYWFGPGADPDDWTIEDDEQYGSHTDATQLDWYEAALAVLGSAADEVYPPTIFFNPPYSRKLKISLIPFVERAVAAAQRGAVVVGLLPASQQTPWYQKYVYGLEGTRWTGFAATEERRIPHRVSFLTDTGEEQGNAGVNHNVIVWRPAPGICGPWTPLSRYWDYL